MTNLSKNFQNHPKENIKKINNNIIVKSPPDKVQKVVVQEESTIIDDGGFPIIKATEGPILVVFGVIQSVAGILMIVFGVMCLMYDAALSNIGAGLWAGAMGFANGVTGISAGYKGCFQTVDRISPLSLTVYLAISLLAIGVENIALVLTATGLLRDSQRSSYYPVHQSKHGLVQLEDSDHEHTNWPPLLINLALLLVISVQCLCTIAAAFRCYLYVCKCKSRRPNQSSQSKILNSSKIQYESADITSSYSSGSSTSKQKLVHQWLGQQQNVNSTNPFYTSSQPPTTYYSIDGKQFCTSSCVSYSDSNNHHYYHMPTQSLHWPRVALRSHSNQKQFKQGDVKRKIRQDNLKEGQRKISKQMTDEEIDKTYTGLDRELAEEFITVTMEPKKILQP